MYAEEVWVAATFRKAVQRFRHPSKAERRKVTIPELVILFTIKIVMCIHLILIDSEPPQWTSWSCRQWSCSGQNLGKQRSNGWVEARAVYTKLQWHIEAVQSFSVFAFPYLSSLFVAVFHDANRLKRHWRCINLWDWNTLMNLDALCISLYPIILLPENVAQSRSSQELLGLVNDPRQLGMWNQSTPGCDPTRGAEWWTLSWFMAVCICKDRFIYIINNL